MAPHCVSDLVDRFAADRAWCLCYEDWTIHVAADCSSHSSLEIPWAGIDLDALDGVAVKAADAVVAFFAAGETGNLGPSRYDRFARDGCHFEHLRCLKGVDDPSSESDAVLFQEFA